VKLGVSGTQLDAIYNLAPGNHTTTVFDMDSNFNVIHHAAVNYSVQALVNGLQIISPSPNQTISMSTVQIVAHATESVAISQMQVWDNGVMLGQYSGPDVNQYFTLSSGSHTLTVEDFDTNNNVLHKASVVYSVQ
jgi:phosphatidylinositol-3-phosphatase